MFKHAVSQELVPESVWRRLLTVETLRSGHTLAPETEPVKPVDIEAVRRTAEHLTPIVRAMLGVQIATGMRPSEVCQMNLKRSIEAVKRGSIDRRSIRRHPEGR